MSAPTSDAIGAEIRAELDRLRAELALANATITASPELRIAGNAVALLRQNEQIRAELAAVQEREARVQRRFFDECETAGWDPAKRNSFAEECAHLHEEVSEAFREWRLHKNFEIRYGADGKPTGIPIELADVLIGLFYNAELHGFDLMAATEIKHRWNLTRRYQDEGRTLHPIAALAEPPQSGEPLRVQLADAQARIARGLALHHGVPDLSCPCGTLRCEACGEASPCSTEVALAEQGGQTP